MVPFYFAIGQTGEAPTSSSENAIKATSSIPQPAVDAVVNQAQRATTSNPVFYTPPTSNIKITPIVLKNTPVPTLQAISPNSTETISPSPASTTNPIDTGNNLGLIILFAIISILALLAISLKLKLKNGENKNKNNNDNRCDNIKQLLEQKKKELQIMIQKWPSDKIEKITKSKITKELKKDQYIKKAIEIKDEVEEKYNKLKETIEILQNKYDLCMLELPSFSSNKTILVDAVDTFIINIGDKFELHKEMFDLLEMYRNNKIILTNADDEQIIKYGLTNLPYELFTLKHNPDKTNPKYFSRMLKQFNLAKDDVVYFEHNFDAVKSAESLGIVTYHYIAEERDLSKLKIFLDKNL